MTTTKLMLHTTAFNIFHSKGLPVASSFFCLSEAIVLSKDPTALSTLGAPAGATLSVTAGSLGKLLSENDGSVAEEV